MSHPSEYVSSFISWCHELLIANPDFKCPTPRSILSDEYRVLHRIPKSPNHFTSNILKPIFLTENIKNSEYTKHMQAKLMCLLSLPVDEEHYEKLTKEIHVILDHYRRIIQYQSEEEIRICRHRKPVDRKRLYNQRMFETVRNGNPEYTSSSISSNCSTVDQNSSPTTSDQLKLLSDLFGSFQTQFQSRLQKLLWVPDPPFPGSFSVENLISPVQFHSSNATLSSAFADIIRPIKQENLED